MIASSGQSEIDSFNEKFKGLSSASFGLEGYPASYCDHLLSSLDYYSAIYKCVIGLAVQKINKPINELSVLDYGAGNGFLGMFARHYGFAKVWMCDPSEVFLEAAKKTASVMNINVEDFILGDINTANNFFRERGVKPDIILATDVIEHIYDLNSFFGRLKELNSNLTFVFTTASNPYNYYKVKQLHKFQHKDEWVGYKDLSKKELETKGVSSLSFYEQRGKIIQANFPSLPDTLTRRLAKDTRGKRKDDIIRSVGHFLNNKQAIVPPEDPHWVCDPETGSWTERILPVSTYEKLFTEHGFSFSMHNGFYNEYSKKGLKALILKFLNRQINKHHGLGKYVAPFIILSGASLTIHK
jgi:2-polyprenyl-3-methyl-5-hydroxy-6-metoxy-1,4-benzoquinol methylase